MKRTFAILLLLFVNKKFSQANILDNKDMPGVIKFGIVSKSCSVISNWNEKIKCSHSEMSNRINTEFLYELENDIKLKIWCNFEFDENGNFLNVEIEPKNNPLKTEFEVFWQKKSNQYYLEDEKGSKKRGKVTVYFWF